MVIVQPNQAWVSDFTYLSYQNKLLTKFLFFKGVSCNRFALFMYLATILDAFTREVIA